MSLDNIQLPAIVLQDLFKNSLIDLNTGKPVLPVENKIKPAFLGNNNKQITIVVNDTNTIYLPDEELNFLMGILAACKLSMADVALVNKATAANLNYTAIDEQLNAQTILLFGITPDALELPLQFPNYQIQKFNNQVYLAAPALQVLQGDKAEKTKLWNCLKQIFAIA